MPTELLAPEKSLNVPLTYPALLAELRKIFQEGVHRAVRAVKEEGLRTSWEAGRAIEAHVRANKPTEAGRAAYGEEIVKKAAKDLGKNPAYLYDGWRLARNYKKFSQVKKLGRSHYRYLLSVDDLRVREALAEEAEKKGWGREEIARRVRRLKAGADSSSGEKIATGKFIPKRGRLGAYQIVARRGTPGLSLDLGFRNYAELPAAAAKNFKEGDIVETRKINVEAIRESSLRLIPHAAKKDLYAYRAHVTKVIDADTYWMKIDVALPVWREDKLRLRGVDAPELKTEAGQKAKKFVEEMFAKYPEIEITTTKPDKYDRYLSDVWISADGRDWLNLNQLLLRKGFATLKTKWSWEDWDTE